VRLIDALFNTVNLIAANIIAVYASFQATQLVTTNVDINLAADANRPFLTTPLMHRLPVDTQ
jgi:hypothetical protein